MSHKKIFGGGMITYVEVEVKAVTERLITGVKCQEDDGK